jgi:hypothetical protein
MSKLKFTDGEEFDTAGPLRLDERYDGWYVIGEGLLLPVKDKKEGLEVIKQMK